MRGGDGGKGMEGVVRESCLRFCGKTSTECVIVGASVHSLKMQFETGNSTIQHTMLSEEERE